MFESMDRDVADTAMVAAFVALLRGVDRDLDDAVRIELLGGLEDAKAACAAAQAKLTADLDRSRRAERAALGIPAEQQGRGIAAEVALARRVSPHQGGRHLGFAQALVCEMPYTLALLESGVLSEWRATLLVRETACLTREDRTEIDHELCADPATLASLGDRALTAKVREHAARRDAEAMVRRARKAIKDRRVTTRPAPDTMAYLTALLPVDQAVAVQARLGRDADSARAGGDERTRSQIMADLLVARVAGIDPAVGPPITINVVLSDRTLLAEGTEPGYLEGFGPIPAQVVARWIHQRAEDSDAADKSLLTLRRLYANPESGALTAMESRSRCYPTGLSRFLSVRDRICRTPWCDAPIRHNDHLVDHDKDGKTSAVNGAGLCEACNYAKQGRGWHATPDPAEPGQLHGYVLATPTGATYHSAAPPLPAPLDVEVEIYTAEHRLMEILYAA